MKKCYFVQEKDEGTGIAVIAESTNQAKSFGHYSDGIDCDWIWLRANVCKENGKLIIPPDDLPIGHIFGQLEGLKLGVYSFAEYCDCPVCKLQTLVRRFDDGSVMCDDCFEANRCNKSKGENKKC